MWREIFILLMAGLIVFERWTPTASSLLFSRGTARGSYNGVAVDSAGNVFLSDIRFVRKVAPDGTVTTVAGNGQSGYSGDYGPATSAAFGGPGNDPRGVQGIYGLATDATGKGIRCRCLQRPHPCFVTPRCHTAPLNHNIIASSPGNGGCGVFSSCNGDLGNHTIYVVIGVRFAAEWVEFVKRGRNHRDAHERWQISTFTVQVTDNTSATATQTLTITISPVLLAITTPSPLVPRGENLAYSQILTASGGTAPYAWSITSGTLPADRRSLLRA